MTMSDPTFIHESGMSFGPWTEEECYYIEKSRLYKKINESEGVTMAEFLVYRHTDKGPELVIVEAKSSSPQPGNAANFDAFIHDISVKLTNALFSYVAAKLGRHGDIGVPECFEGLDLAQTRIKFVLVIKDHRAEWLPPLQDYLKKVFHPLTNIWALSSVVVFNETMARKDKLVARLNLDATQSESLETQEETGGHAISERYP